MDNVIPTQDQWQDKMYHCTISHPLEDTLQVATNGSYKEWLQEGEPQQIGAQGQVLLIKRTTEDMAAHQPLATDKLGL